jgi:3-oxoacyl-[acyl-carrier protein] reductase
MSDVFLQLSGNPYARKVVKSLGLPLPMPPPLRRAKGGWEARPLDGRTVVLGGQGSLRAAVSASVKGAGANEAGSDTLGDARPDAVVFDASGLKDPAALRSLYDFFHPLVGKLAPSGRALIVARPPSEDDAPAEAAARQALDGFVRSLAREIGKRGATANLLWVDEGAEGRVDGVLRFLLTDHSAFISGQPLHVTSVVKEVGGKPGHFERSLEGKVALVTGAARGIGAATAKLLAREGAHVVCLDRPADGELAGQVARELRGSVLLADVSSEDAAAKIVSELQARHGGVDVVVHNAGVTRDKTLLRMKQEQWEQALGINLAAVLRITDALVEKGLRDGGRVICLSSIAGIAGNLGQTNYSASKAGVIGLVRAYAPKLAKRGISVNAVAPGFIETRLTDAVPLVIREVGRRLSNLSQGGQPEDVGELVTFLATPFSSGVTGQVIRVCGGAYVGA